MHTLVFDIDGTLIESMAIDSDLYFGAIEQVLGPVRFRDLNEYEHVTDDGILSQVFDDNGIAQSAEITKSIKQLFVAGIRAHIDDDGGFPGIDGARRFFNTARESNCFKVAVATGGWRESACLKLQSADLDIAGVPMATSDDARSRVEIMQLALAKAGGEVDSVTYFGDADWDRRACSQLGWRFIPVGPHVDGITSYAEIDLNAIAAA
ncbi:MAG: HAD family hydrolase [Pseudomonadota bacterium]